jgi:hypothetical protein
MPKRISSKKRDANQTASAVVALAVLEETPDINPNVLSQIMSAMGRKGGKIGGKRRLETMSAKERSRVAKKAANARWAKSNA